MRGDDDRFDYVVEVWLHGMCSAFYLYYCNCAVVSVLRVVELLRFSLTSYRY